jgi:hypothetical protein
MSYGVHMNDRCHSERALCERAFCRASEAASPTIFGLPGRKVQPPAAGSFCGTNRLKPGGLRPPLPGSFQGIKNQPAGLSRAEQGIYPRRQPSLRDQRILLVEAIPSLSNLEIPSAKYASQ